MHKRKILFPAAQSGRQYRSIPDLKGAESSIPYEIVVGTRPLGQETWQTFHDLKSLNLSCEETYNVWCDRIAQKTWELGQASISDPSVLPSKRWAVYSRHPTYHKLTGKFDNGIYSTSGYTDLQEYLHQKHNPPPALLDKVNVHALQGFCQH